MEHYLGFNSFISYNFFIIPLITGFIIDLQLIENWA